MRRVETLSHPAARTGPDRMGQPPVLPQPGAIVTAAAGALALAGVASAAVRLFSLSDQFTLKALLVFSAVMLTALWFVRSRHPFDRFGGGNLTTTVRAALIALLAACLGEPGATTAAASLVVVATVAAGLDALDGWLARRAGLQSAFGARFDMEVDAVLILVLAALAWQLGKAGTWVLLSGLLRYAFVAASGVAPWLARPLPSSIRRKTVCVIQIVALIVVIGPPVGVTLSTIVAAAALALLAWSFWVDITWLYAARAAAPRRVS